MSFPIILGPDGRVLDGMHWVARAVLEGRKRITAVRSPSSPIPAPAQALADAVRITRVSGVW